MTISPTKQIKRTKNILKTLKKLGFEIKEIEETYGKSYETSDCYCRLNHEKFKKILIGGLIPEIYVKYTNQEAGRFVFSFSLVTKNGHSFIPFIFNGFKMTLMPYHDETDDLKEHLSNLLSRFNEFIEYIHSLEIKKISTKDKSELLEKLVASRFQNRLLNPKYKFDYENFESDQFLTPLKKTSADTTTIWGFFLTVYVNLFDEVDYAKATLPTLMKATSDKRVYEVEGPITYIRKKHYTRRQAGEELEKFVKLKEAGLKLNFGF